MIEDLLRKIDKIYIAYGVTDFRLRTPSLCRLIENKFKVSPYKHEAFIFCNKRRNSIRVLCYDRNGFVLAEKTLVDAEKMKFQWPRHEEELKRITKQQLTWLLSGLKICPDKYFRDINLEEEKIAI